MGGSNSGGLGQLMGLVRLPGAFETKADRQASKFM